MHGTFTAGHEGTALGPKAEARISSLVSFGCGRRNFSQSSSASPTLHLQLASASLPSVRQRDEICVLAPWMVASCIMLTRPNGAVFEICIHRMGSGRLYSSPVGLGAMSRQRLQDVDLGSQRIWQPLHHGQPSLFAN